MPQPFSRCPVACALLLPAVFVTHTALASCGGAFCTLLTDDFAPGSWTHTGWRSELRFEYLNQTTLRAGTHSPDAAALASEEAIERSSRNANLIGSIDYAFTHALSIGLQIPLIDRAHTHDLPADADHGTAITESWQYTRLGDVRALLRYQQAGGDDGARLLGVTAGLKLPTGSTTVTNADGTPAERTLQPGTGTLDVVMGGTVRSVLSPRDAAFGALTGSVATHSHDGYRPGARVELSAGWSHALSPTWGTALQLNALHKARDAGEHAEPDNSGLTTLLLSPGLTLALSDESSAYAFVQLPLYQQVNGIQLVQKWSLAAGLTRHF